MEGVPQVPLREGDLGGGIAPPVGSGKERENDLATLERPGKRGDAISCHQTECSHPIHDMRSRPRVLVRCAHSAASVAGLPPRDDKFGP